MNVPLQLWESEDENYPNHFEAFLNNCIHEFPQSFSQSDYLFAAVYFIILESGFSPLTEQQEDNHSNSDSFDIRKLRTIKSYNTSVIKESSEAGHRIYVIPLKLGNYRNVCELQGVLSGESCNHIIVNFIVKPLKLVRSLCLSTELFTEKNCTQSKHSFRLRNLQELSILVKNKLSESVKSAIVLNEAWSCCPNFLCIPESLQKKIIYHLIKDPFSIIMLALTCSYFESLIESDEELINTVSLSGVKLSKEEDLILEKVLCAERYGDRFLRYCH